MLGPLQSNKVRKIKYLKSKWRKYMVKKGLHKLELYLIHEYIIGVRWNSYSALDLSELLRCIYTIWVRTQYEAFPLGGTDGPQLIEPSSLRI